jgi:hypothetical protein
LERRLVFVDDAVHFNFDERILSILQGIDISAIRLIEADSLHDVPILHPHPSLNIHLLPEAQLQIPASSIPITITSIPGMLAEAEVRSISTMIDPGYDWPVRTPRITVIMA